MQNCCFLYIFYFRRQQTNAFASARGPYAKNPSEYAVFVYYADGDRTRRYRCHVDVSAVGGRPAANVFAAAAKRQRPHRRRDVSSFRGYRRPWRAAVRVHGSARTDVFGPPICAPPPVPRQSDERRTGTRAAGVRAGHTLRARCGKACSASSARRGTVGAAAARRGPDPVAPTGPAGPPRPVGPACEVGLRPAVCPEDAASARPAVAAQAAPRATSAATGLARCAPPACDRPLPRSLTARRPRRPAS